MKRIMLACSAGMSTSLLVTKMEQAAKDKGEDCKIWAVPIDSVKEKLGEFDVLLLGPQVRFKLKEFEKLVDGKAPVAVIDMRDYGTMNGPKVIEVALKMYDEFYK